MNKSTTRIESVVRLAEAETLWAELRAAKHAGMTCENAEPGSIWVRLHAREVNFDPVITKVRMDGAQPDLLVRSNVPASTGHFLRAVQSLCHEAIRECRFYEFVPTGTDHGTEPGT